MKINSRSYSTLSPLQKSLLVIEDLESKVKELEANINEPIAIIGMDCLFPEANDSKEFWDLLYNEKSSICRTPHERWNNINGGVDLSFLNNKENSHINFGGFIDNPYDFDNTFFNISPQEAESIDPQQRIVLEVLWHALENASICHEELIGSISGIFIGVGQNDYAQLNFSLSNIDDIGLYDGIGNGLCSVAGRLSYMLGLQGPTISVDTACSSSLVALHLACNSLRNKECNIAIAAAVQLMLSPLLSTYLTKIKALSPTHTCKAFDANADGYVRSEGCGVLILKRLSDALKNGDEVLAIIRASSINHNGLSSGFTVPNGNAQYSLIDLTIKKAGIVPEDITFIEAHGTGTPLGDPIEVEALGRVFSGVYQHSRPLFLGSVKTNIGHAEAAAGMASLIKTILAIQKEYIPASLHFNTPNPQIDWQNLPFKIPGSGTPWHRKDNKPLIAGISSFGITGTNAHVILEEAPIQENTRNSPMPQKFFLLALSAKSKNALYDLTAKYVNFIKDDTLYSLENICFTANTCRSHFEYRTCFIAEDLKQLKKDLIEFNNAKEITKEFLYLSERKHEIVMVFDGENDADNVVRLRFYKDYKKFQLIFESCEKIVIKVLDKSLTNINYKDLYKKLLEFCFEYALFEFYSYIGVRTNTLLGNGVLGELLAACAAEIISLEDSLDIYIKYLNINSELNIQRKNELKNVLKTSLQSIEFTPPILSIISIKSGELLFNKMQDSCYWEDKLCNHQALSTDIQFPAAKFNAVVIFLNNTTCLTSNEEIHNYITMSAIKKEISIVQDELAFVQSLKILYESGVDIRWKNLYEGYKYKKSILPNYPFQRKTFFKHSLTNNSHQDYSDKGTYIYLGQRINIPSLNKIIFNSEINLKTTSFLNDHVILGEIVVPGAYYLSMAIEAGKELFNTNLISVKNIYFPNILKLKENDLVQIQFIVNHSNKNNYSFEVTSLNPESNDGFLVHAVGQLVNKEKALDFSTDIEAKKSSRYLNSEEAYQMLRVSGIELGDRFKWLKEIYISSVEATATLELPFRLTNNHDLLPTLIDACFQLFGINVLNMDINSLHLPFSLDEIHYSNSLTLQYPLHCKVSNFQLPSNTELSGDISLFDDSGARILSITDFQVKKFDPSKINASNFKDKFYHLEWKAHKIQETNYDEDEVQWIIFTSKNKICHDICERISSKTNNYSLVNTADDYSVMNNVYNIRPNVIDDFHNMLMDVSARVHFKKIKILYFWSTLRNNEIESINFDEIYANNCIGILYLIQALALSKLNFSSRLWLLTSGLKGKNFNPGSVFQAMAWGFGQVICLEHPELNCVRIDVGDSTDDNVNLLYNEFFSFDDESQIVNHHGERFVGRLNRSTFTQSTSEIIINNKGAYLITGGLGGLGIETAKWLIKQGAKHLVLVSRNLASSKVADEIEKLRLLDANIHVMQYDISDIKQVRELFSKIELLTIPLSGIFHTAGLLDDKLIIKQNREDFSKVLRPKVQGTWNLNVLTKNLHLDFFVCFSSAAGIIGSTGQANYAAANTFMDALMQERGHEGLAAISIAWGPWLDIGMSKYLLKTDSKKLSLYGIKPIELMNGFNILSYLMLQNNHFVAAILVSWQDFMNQIKSTNLLSFFSELVNDTSSTHISSSNVFDRAVLPRRPQLEVEYVKPTTKEEIVLEQIWCEVLGFEKVGIHDNFFELGGDSINSLQISHHANRINLNVTTRDIFNEQTIAKLAKASNKASLLDMEQHILDRNEPAKIHYDSSDFPLVNIESSKLDEIMMQLELLE